MNKFNYDVSIMEPKHKMPLIGDKAPEFTANTTNGKINFPSDFNGKWIILFSHPSDFTPVCTTEFIEFQNIKDELQKLNTALVGLSVGANSSHLAWFDAIEKMDIDGKHIKITFPLIEDLNMHVANLYGMIHPNMSDTHAVRAVFIIDTKGIIRTIFYYPATTGRNIEEILRTLIALQTADAFGVATPANWFPGHNVIIPAPNTAEKMHKYTYLKHKDYDVKSWFLIMKKLSDKSIYQKLYKNTAKK